MKMVYYKRPGGPDVLRIKEVPNPPCVTIDLIMIQVAAAGLNVYDAWRRQGGSFYQSVFIDHMGYECSGKVIAVGPKVDKVKVEYRSTSLLLLENGDAYAEFVVAPACQAFQIPSCVSVVEAAALLEASRLTFFAFSGLTNVTPGKTILIHGAAAGIDFIAIQYAKYIGCQVFAVAGTVEKMKLSKLLGADVGINYKTEDFSKRVKAETKGKGVDIILDGSGIEHFQKNLDCLARGGSLVVLGAKVGGLVDIDLSVLMKKDITIIGVDMQNLSFANRHRLLSDAVAKFWPLIEAGYIKPIIGKIFTFTEAVKEHIEPWRRIVFQENCC